MRLSTRIRRQAARERELEYRPESDAPAGEGFDEFFLRPRRAWNERYGGDIQASAQWRYAAFAALGVAFVAVTWAGYVSSQSRFIPFIVETDKLGDAVAVRPVAPSQIKDERVIDAQLARWIVDVRSVYNDAAAENALLTESYATVQSGTAGYVELNNYLHSNNPFQAGMNKTVTVDVHSVLPISANVYQIKWTENEVGKNDGTASSSDWTAIMTVTVIPPSSYGAIVQNPAGVYITQFSWSQDVN